MKLITVFWKERGYSREMFWLTDVAMADRALDRARCLVSNARMNCGVFGVRVVISNHPTK